MPVNWFDQWDGVLRIVCVACFAYLALIVFLRISGKRTLTQMNAFDFIVTIALGSMLSTTILDRSMPLAEGLGGILTLILLQFLITWLSMRVPLVDRLIKASPAKLVEEGEMRRKVMRRERITEEEIWAALRQGGWNRLQDVKSVTIETNGKLTVVYEKK